MTGEKLKELGYGCIYGVGKGAASMPRIVCILYKGRELAKEEDFVADIGFVGKGVTFDSGGLNLKGTGMIENMHLDKTGACCVLAAMSIIAELKLPINVVGCLALAENCINETCYKPSDILKSFNGKTVEIGNTDAEGRLCLIDGMAHV